MNKKPIDKSKKSNVYCAHCKHWSDYIHISHSQNRKLEAHCTLTGERKEYWNRCKQFEWMENLLYK